MNTSDNARRAISAAVGGKVSSVEIEKTRYSGETEGTFKLDGKLRHFFYREKDGFMTAFWQGEKKMSPNETVTTHEILVSPGKDLKTRTIFSRLDMGQPAVYPYITGKADRVDVVVEYEEDGTRVRRKFSPEELVQIAKSISMAESWSTKPPKEDIRSFTVNVDFGKLLRALGIVVEVEVE